MGLSGPKTRPIKNRSRTRSAIDLFSKNLGGQLSSSPQKKMGGVTVVSVALHGRRGKGAIFVVDSDSV